MVGSLGEYEKKEIDNNKAVNIKSNPTSSTARLFKKPVIFL